LIREHGVYEAILADAPYAPIATTLGICIPDFQSGERALAIQVQVLEMYTDFVRFLCISSTPSSVDPLLFFKVRNFQTQPSM
jgi:hypothetical protein